jgi:MFS family permease
MLGAINFGYNMGFPEAAVGLDFESESELLWFKSSAYITAMIGPLFTWLLLKVTGRRALTFVFASTSAFSWLLFLLPVPHPLDWFKFVVWAFCGLSLGAMAALIPLYLVELAPPGSTGFFGTLNQVGIGLGFVAVYAFGLMPKSDHGYLHFWHILALIGAAFMVLLCGLVWLVEESPAVTPPDRPAPPPDAQLPDETLFTGKGRKRLLISAGLMLFQQLTGINFYHTKLDWAGDDWELPVYTSIAQVVSCTFGAFLIKKIHHRFVWTLSLGFVAVVNFAYAIALKVTSNPLAKLHLAFIFLFLIGFGFGAGPIPWFFPAAIFSRVLAPSAQAIITSFNWILAFAVSLGAGELLSGARNWVLYLACGVLSAGGAVFGFFFAFNPDNDVIRDPRYRDLYRDVTGSE